jgi:predicted glycosyltransferase
MRLWYDACTGKQVRYGAAIGQQLRKAGHEFIFTTREHPDTIPLAKILNVKPIVVGKYNHSTLFSRLEESAQREAKFPNSLPIILQTLQLRINQLSSPALLSG